MNGLSEAIHEETFQVKALECDLNQNLKPAAFFQRLSEAAGFHATQLGVGYEAFYAQNLFWMHSRMKIKIFRSPRLGENVMIRTWPKTVQQKLFFIRDFEVWDASGKQLAAATSAWLIVNATTRRLVPPQALNLNLPALNDRFGLDEPLDRLDQLQNAEERLCVRAGYSAIDVLGHVNNSRYVEWICDIFPVEMYQRSSLDWMQINYDHEVLPGEEVSILVKPPEGNSSTWAVEGLNRSNNTHVFEAIVHWAED